MCPPSPWPTFRFVPRLIVASQDAVLQLGGGTRAFPPLMGSSSTASAPFQQQQAPGGAIGAGGAGNGRLAGAARVYSRVLGLWGRLVKHLAATGLLPAANRQTTTEDGISMIRRIE